MTSDKQYGVLEQKRRVQYTTVQDYLKKTMNASLQLIEEESNPTSNSIQPLQYKYKYITSLIAVVYYINCCKSCSTVT